MIISIEGLDGVGKSYLARALASNQQQLLSEPGGTELGELIRFWIKGQRLPDIQGPLILCPAGQQVLAAAEEHGAANLQRLIAALLQAERLAVPSAEQLSLSALEEAALFNIARAQLLADIPDQRQIIFDRFIDSTIAYQGYGCQASVEVISEFNRLASQGRAPERTFYLRLDEQQRRQRLNQRAEQADRLEQRSAEFFARAAAGFEQLAAENPERIITLDARLGPQELAAEARKFLPAGWE